MNILLEKSDLTILIQSHLEFTPFNYEICIDWAKELLQQGVITDDIQMLASFSKSVDSWEMKPYVQRILKDFNHEEYDGEKAFGSYAYYHVLSILKNDGNMLDHLKTLCQLCIDSDYDEGLYPFYLLKFSWEDLKDLGMSCHYEAVTFSNFDNTVLKEANIWMGKFKNLK